MKDLETYRAWLVLKLLPDVGSGRFNRLVARFGSPEAVLEASSEALSQVDGVGQMTVKRFSKARPDMA